MNTGVESRGAGKGNMLVRPRISGAIDSATSWRAIVRMDRNMTGMSHLVSQFPLNNLTIRDVDYSQDLVRNTSWLVAKRCQVRTSASYDTAPTAWLETGFRKPLYRLAEWAVSDWTNSNC